MAVKRFLPLTPKQKAIGDFVSQYHHKNGYAPSLEEIAKKFGLHAVSTVHEHIQIIRNKGYLRKEEFQARGISPLSQKPGIVEVPLLGKIAAGNPIEPIENPEPIAVPDFMIKRGNDYYALQVKGNSMIDDGVWDGDTILVKHQNTANIGDMIVAVVDGEVTLKRFGGYKGGKIELIPKNKNIRPFYVDPDNFEVRGKFAGLLRKG